MKQGENLVEQPKLRSPEVQDLVSKKPTWPLRWGSLFILSLIVAAFFLARWIKYPEVIEGFVQLSLKEAPLEIVSVEAGILEELRVKDGAEVTANTILARLKEPLDPAMVLSLKPFLSDLKDSVENDQLFSDFYRPKISNGGILQENLSELFKTLAHYQALLKDSLLIQSLAFMKTEINQHRQLYTVLYKKKRLAERVLRNAKEDFAGDEYLYKQEVLSKMQYFEERNQLTKQELAVEDLRKEIIENDIRLSHLEKEKLELQRQYQQDITTSKGELLKQIEGLSNRIYAWEEGKLFKANFSGKIRYRQKLREGQYLQAGEPLMVLIPPGQSYLGRLEIRARGQGKVQVGQKLFVKLDNFPSAEFGELLAQVSQVSELPSEAKANTEDTYWVYFELQGPLVSTYKKQINGAAIMTGTGRVITEDLSLLSRIFAPLKEMWKRQG